MMHKILYKIKVWCKKEMKSLLIIFSVVIIFRFVIRNNQLNSFLADLIY